jgi:hypothetical protein
MLSKLPVVFEQQGSDGKRRVAFTNGAVEEVDTARYEALMKIAGPAKPADNRAQ